MAMPGGNSVKASIREAFISPNENDRNREPANVVDGLFAISRSIRYLADTIKEIDETREREYGSRNP